MECNEFIKDKKKKKILHIETHKNIYIIILYCYLCVYSFPDFHSCRAAVLFIRNTGCCYKNISYHKSFRNCLTSSGTAPALLPTTVRTVAPTKVDNVQK